MADISADVPTAIQNSPDQAYFNRNFGGEGAPVDAPPMSWIPRVFVAISTPTVPDVTPPIVIQGGTVEGSSGFNTGIN